MRFLRFEIHVSEHDWFAVLVNLGVLVIALAISGTGLAAPASQALVGATVIDGTGAPPIENGVVLIEGDRIACVGERKQCPLVGDVSTVDLSGAFITPGLVDTHVHFAQTGWVAGRWENLPNLYPVDQVHAELRANPGRWHRAYLCSGVTAVFDVGGAPWTITETDGGELGRADRVHVRAAGPLMTWVSRDADRFLEMDSEDQIRADIARIRELGSAALKVWFLDPPAARREELEAMLDVVGEAARDTGLRMIVHAPELRNAKAALRAGAKMLVHSVWDAPVDDEFLELLAANDAWYAPTLVVDYNWMKSTGSIVHGVPAEIDDPNRCVDEGTLARLGEVDAVRAEIGDGNLPTFQRGMQGVFNAGQRLVHSQYNLRAVRDAGGRIVLATDAGNSLTLHGPSVHWELEAMENAGLTPREIIHGATLEGARALGMSEQIGSLEAGKLADLLVLAEDPRLTVRNFRSLTHVMRAGRLKRQSDLRVR